MQNQFKYPKPNTGFYNATQIDKKYAVKKEDFPDLLKVSKPIKQGQGQGQELNWKGINMEEQKEEKKDEKTDYIILTYDENRRLIITPNMFIRKKEVSPSEIAFQLTERWKKYKDDYINSYGQEAYFQNYMCKNKYSDDDDDDDDNDDNDDNDNHSTKNDDLDNK